MQLSSIARKMIRAICILVLALIVGSAIYYRSLSCLPFVWGVLLGALTSVAKVFLQERAAYHAMTMEKKAAAGYVFLQYLLRLLFTGAALMLAVFVPAISLWGMVSGIATYQIATYYLRFVLKP